MGVLCWLFSRDELHAELLGALGELAENARVRHFSRARRIGGASVAIETGSWRAGGNFVW